MSSSAGLATRTITVFAPSFIANRTAERSAVALSATGKSGMALPLVLMLASRTSTHATTPSASKLLADGGEFLVTRVALA
jgi:hypothetical protein